MNEYFPGSSVLEIPALIFFSRKLANLVQPFNESPASMREATWDGREMAWICTLAVSCRLMRASNSQLDPGPPGPQIATQFSWQFDISGRLLIVSIISGSSSFRGCGGEILRREVFVRLRADCLGIHHLRSWDILTWTITLVHLNQFNMDGLSLAANVIQVVQAASTVARKLEKLRSFREAPAQLLQVINEVVALERKKYLLFRCPIFELSLQLSSKHAQNSMRTMNWNKLCVWNSKACSVMQKETLIFLMKLQKDFYPTHTITALRDLNFPGYFGCAREKRFISTRFLCEASIERLGGC